MGGMKDHYLGGDLFSYRPPPPAQYPHAPGFRDPSTSREAATKMKSRAETLRDKALELLRSHPGGLTVHEAVALAGVTVQALQPRFSELHAQEKIKRSTERRRNASGMSAAVWIISEE